MCVCHELYHMPPYMHFADCKHFRVWETVYIPEQEARSKRAIVIGTIGAITLGAALGAGIAYFGYRGR